MHYKHCCSVDWFWCRPRYIDLHLTENQFAYIFINIFEMFSRNTVNYKRYREKDFSMLVGKVINCTLNWQNTSIRANSLEILLWYTIHIPYDVCDETNIIMYLICFMWYNCCYVQFQFTITIESDTKMTEIEKNEMMDWRPVKITREIVDGKMICVSSLTHFCFC